MFDMHILNTNGAALNSIIYATVSVLQHLFVFEDRVYTLNVLSF